MLNDLPAFRKIKNGDIRAFESLFRRYYEALGRHAFRFVNDWNLAEEIVQEVFYILWKNRGHLQITVAVRAYLYKAVKNKSLQYIEHLKVREKHRESVSENQQEPFAQNGVNHIEYKELQDYIAKALSGMPERRSKIFRMNREEGKKYTEIAQELSISVKTVEAEISKALYTLKKGIKDYQ